MKRLFTALSLAAGLLAAALPASASAATQPNVIVILTDDLGYGDVYNLHQHVRDNGAGGGIAGDGIINGSEEPFIYTPEIDRMAAEGAKLTRHYTSAPVCAPARGSLLQGRDQGHANIRNNSFDKVISDNHTLGTVMQQAGYYTAVVGKWGVGGTTNLGAGRPNERGFDYFYGYMEHLDGHEHYPGNSGKVIENTTRITSGLANAYTTDLFTAKAKSLIIDRATNHSTTPFFIYLAYDAPHAQLQVPTQAYPSGKGTSGGLSWPLNTNSGTNDSWIHPDYRSLGTSAARHATMVRRLDTCLGDLLQTLRDLGIDDNTLVVFTSDNGTHDEPGAGPLGVAHNPRNFDSYGELEGIKRDHWEGGIRMPTFAWWPGKIGDNNAATPGLNSTRPSAFWDWMPTLCDAAGAVPPAWTSGVSLLPELTGNGSQLDKGYLYFEYQNGGRTPSYSDFPNHGGSYRGEMQSIFLTDPTDGKRYKGVRYNVTSHTQDFLIYDVDTDPGEGTNLATSKTSLQQAMKDKVLQVRIDGDYTRNYLSGVNTPPAPPASAVSGLDYKAFTGTWDWVPETAYLTPVASGTASGLDLTKRTQDDNCLLEFTGFIQIPTDGTYTFTMTTDSSVSTNASGGMLWIHDAHIIDDDFNHNGSAKSGSMRLKAGLHPVRILYKHTSGSHDINLQYSGPGITTQTIPESSFFRAGTPDPVPSALPDAAESRNGAAVEIDVLANDFDDNAPSPLSIASVGTPAFGTAVISNGKIEYTPFTNHFGTDKFTYSITDGEYTVEGEVTVNVTHLAGDLWIPLNETSGSSVAEVGGVTVGSLSGFANTETSHIPGKVGYALAFDGTDDQIPLTGITLPTGDAPRTVSAWVRVTTTSAPEYQVIFNYGQNNNGERFSFRLDTASQANQRLRLEVQGGFIVGSTRINDGEWHHVAAVVDDFDSNGTTSVSETKLYVDGKLETISSSGSRAINTSGVGTPLIGAASHAPNYNFQGDIDEVRVINRALDITEVASLANPTNQLRDAWRERHFGTTTPDWTTDADNDSSELIEEYGFGSNPHIPDTSNHAPSVQLNPTSGKLEITFNRRKPGTHDLTYSVEVSDNLASWTLPTTEVSVTDHPTLEGFDQVTVASDADLATSARLFIRMNVN
ncbi:sulfatase-like hydrolase/transferase [Sulfuriroseicoccus oceanibius]|uniref:Sulfatase-like hydrolase/transferase n=1 Tax=Sulfuriroseicoccus oceanibius TaxID=2707525 RepID=A0A6B3LCR5_9BACT|nr:sulfatase-like hydrolase/transferase [Sulfuriroseicoccus oceanibius]QQL44826.1 sulfatase-like hydrolase/transferase [Sulfuriroseicoccus oceanibius]